MKFDDDRIFYGWDDVANFQEAIIFYADMFARGYHHHEICRMLNGYFPNINRLILSKIRVKAIEWMRAMATNLETKIYFSKSILRLERICANPHEKTRNVLIADNQLTHLLGLVDVQEQAGPEEMAVFIRAFNKDTKTATDGSGYTAAQEVTQEAAKNPESQEVKSQEVKSKSLELQETEQQLSIKFIDEIDLSEDEIKISENLREARALRLQTDIDSIDDEIKASNEKHHKQQCQKTSKELQDEIDLSVYD